LLRKKYTSEQEMKKYRYPESGSIMYTDDSEVGISNSYLGVIYELPRKQPLVKAIIYSPSTIPTVERQKFD